MNNLSGREKFEKCAHKGYRSCPQYENPIMRKAILQDIPKKFSDKPIYLPMPAPEDEEKAAKLCESCDSFRTL